MTLVWYVPTKTTWIISLSTLHCNDAIDESNDKKSEINQIYNAKKRV